MPSNDRLESLKGDPDSPDGNTPYSRTPELRVTHKLAERKRRSEMKDCFEQLRSKLPAGQTNKSSKWETLARGEPNSSASRMSRTDIVVSAIDYISQLEGQNKSTQMELARQRDQMHQMELQMKELSSRMNGGSFSHPPPPNSIPQYNGGVYTNGGNTEDSRTLPPIMNGGAMQGVQYGENGR